MVENFCSLLFLPLDPKCPRVNHNSPQQGCILIYNLALYGKLTYYARKIYGQNRTQQRGEVKEPTTDGHNDRQCQEAVRGQVFLFTADWSWECHRLGLTNNSSDSGSCWITRRRFRIRIATRILKRNFHFIVSHIAPIEFKVAHH